MTGDLFVGDVKEPEGPAWCADGSLYLVEMGADRRCVTHVDRTGKRRTIATTAQRPQGIALDGLGRLWVAEGYEGVLCFSADGVLLKRISGDGDGRFLWPNDLAFGANGRLYMTDSGIREEEFIDGLTIRSDFTTAPYDGRVYEIDPASGKVIRKVNSGIRFTNGIAFGPDGLLYVNETITGHVYRYDVRVGQPARREIFGNVVRKDLPPGFRGPDGMKFGSDGRLYCTVYGQGDVTVLDSSGNVAERIPTTGPKPTNLAFALNDRYAVVTEVARAAVEIIRTKCTGLPLHYPTFSI